MRSRILRCKRKALTGFEGLFFIYCANFVCNANATVIVLLKQFTFNMLTHFRLDWVPLSTTMPLLYC